MKKCLFCDNNRSRGSKECDNVHDEDRSSCMAWGCDKPKHGWMDWCKQHGSLSSDDGWRGIADQIETQEDYEKSMREQPTPKKNEGKPRMGLVEWGFIEGIAEALTFGATKYPEKNYLNLPSELLFESLLRHISAIRQGKTTDDESGLHHAKHVAANCMMWFETLKKEGKL